MGFVRPWRYRPPFMVGPIRDVIQDTAGCLKDEVKPLLNITYIAATPGNCLMHPAHPLCIDHHGNVMK